MIEIPEMMAYSEGTGGVTGSGPTGTTVQTHTLILDNLEQTAAAEGLGVSLTLNLQDVQGKEDNFSNADQTSHIISLKCISPNGPSERLSPASSCVHDGLASSLSESIVESGTVVLSKVVTGKGLTTVLVNSLEDLFGQSQRMRALSRDL